MAACWPLQMAPADKAVLVSLADNASDEGVCWPSVPTIAMRTCLSVRTVQMALKRLEGRGLVERELQQRANGSASSSVYRLRVEAILQASKAAQEARAHARPPRSSCTTPPAAAAPPPRSSCTP